MPLWIQRERIEHDHYHLDFVYEVSPQRRQDPFADEVPQNCRWFSLRDLTDQKVPQSVRYSAERLISRTTTLTGPTFSFPRQLIDASKFGDVSLVVGTPGSGKTSLSVFLLEQISNEMGPAGLVDADLGGGFISPPMTMTAVAKRDSSLLTVAGVFVGEITPARRPERVARAVSYLVNSVQRQGARKVLVDMGGLVYGDRAPMLYRQVIDAVRPDQVFALIRAGESNPLLALFESHGVTVVRVRSSNPARPHLKDRIERRRQTIREYFAEATVTSVDAERVTLWREGRRFSAQQLLGVGSIVGFLDWNDYPVLAHCLRSDPAVISFNIPLGHRIKRWTGEVGALTCRTDGQLIYTPDPQEQEEAKLHFPDA